jgi:23S rRNA (cytidine2498-2'-O)-methyltransferase
MMTDTPWQPRFLYAVCQRGAEATLKRELANQQTGMQPAFSRPGFVTFKQAKSCLEPEKFSLTSTFARAWGFSLGNVSGTHLLPLAKEVWQLPEVAQLLAAPQLVTAPLKTIHVWQRDLAIPGRRGFEPGITPLAEEIHRTLSQVSPIESLRHEINHLQQPAARNRWVLDVVLVEPGTWWIGCHLATHRLARYPGGVLPVTMPPQAVSRAYLKLTEALRWSSLPVARGDRCVDLGCAPGGCSQALLDRGLHVIGVDPAEVDPIVTEHPRFIHLRKRSTHLAGRQLKRCQWLMADINATPNYTLDAVEAIVTHSQVSIRGMLLTLKLSDWHLADSLPQYIERVRSWGYQDIRARQLAHNGQELCLAALRSRKQRRLRRSGRRQVRQDSAHASVRGPHGME